MSNWFDDKQFVTPENPDNETPEVTDTALPGNEEANADAPEESAADTTAADSPAEPASAPSQTAGWSGASSYQSGWSSNSSQPAYPSEPSTPNNTYHYGVNSSNPVPNSTNQYTSPAQSNQPSSPNYSYQTPQTPNGYQPQGGYSPYGWQRPNVPLGQQPTPTPSPAPSGKPPRKKKKASTIAIAAVGVLCAAAIVTLSVLLAMAVTDNGLPTGSNTNTSSTGSQVDTSSPALELVENDADAQGLTTRSIVQMNLGSTVVITIYSKQNGFGGSNSLAEAGAASGIIMSADGYIITNWHVVVNESTGTAYDRIDVTTYDGTVYKDAKIIGADEDTDLAVIKVSAAKLTPAKFGDSAALQLGDKIVAIGNAGGLSWTTTQGIVSGLARDVYDDTGYAIQCLQIDAAINPGNSGGPLLNAQGQVVGVNSAKIVAEGYEGLGFSIPITEAKVIIDDLIKYGYVKNRVVLGITGRDITQPGYEGFQIATISDSSCFKGTDAQVGDIITAINGETVASGTEVRNQLSKHKVGDTVTITLMRVDSRNYNRNTFTITVTLKEYSIS